MVFQVLIRKDDGDFRLNVANTEREALNKTVRDLKQKLRERVRRVPGDQDILMSFAGMSMNDNDKLGDYGIEHLSIISVTLRMTGGGGP